MNRPKKLDPPPYQRERRLGAVPPSVTATATSSLTLPEWSESAHLPDPGETLGRYRIIELIGQGGIGVVYAARDQDLQRTVALKLLRKNDPVTSGVDRARLLGEARAMARLEHHPNVVKVYEVATAGGRDFVAMEHVDGCSLDIWLRVGRHSWREVLAVFIQAGMGLGAVHAAGLVHRDFKPANVLIDCNEQARVTDFGLALMAAERAGSTALARGQPGSGAGLTRTGQLVGTPAYMAPEQYQGKAADIRSDQYGFCVALYEGLYGERPFAGSSPEELAWAQARGELPPVRRGSHVPRYVRRVLVRGLASDPDRRFASMDELLAALAPRRRRAAGVTAVLAALAACALALAMRATEPAHGVPVACTTERMDEVWSEPVRAELRRAFAGDREHAVDASDRNSTESEVGGRLATDLESEPAGLTTAMARIDARVMDWDQAHGQICAAPEQTTFQPRMACLVERRDQLATAVRALFAIARTSHDRGALAARVTDELADMRGCEAITRWPGRPNWTIYDQKQMHRVHELRTQLLLARAQQDAWRLLEARERVRAVVTEARAMNQHRWLLAEALHRQGIIESMLRQHESANAALVEAASLARDAGHHGLVARVLAAQAQREVQRFAESSAGGLDRVHGLVREASAAAAAEPEDERALIEAALDITRASVMYKVGLTEPAMSLLARTVAVYERAGWDLAAVRAVDRMADVEDWSSQYDRALARWAALLGRYTALVGPQHPEVLQVRYKQAQMRSWLGADKSDGVRWHEHGWPGERSRRLLEVMVPPRPGRLLRGRVVDGGGAPVAGAEVVAGVQLRGDSRHHMSPVEPVGARTLGLVRGLSDQRGDFELMGASTERVVVSAETEDGRTAPVVVPAGEQAAAVELTVMRPGRIRGRVFLSRMVPHEHPMVALSPHLPGAPSAVHLLVAGSPDGYALSHLASGRYVVQAGLISGRFFRVMDTHEVDIRSGEEVELDLDLMFRGASLHVLVRGHRNEPLDSVTSALVPGAATVSSFAQLSELAWRESGLRRSDIGPEDALRYAAGAAEGRWRAEDLHLRFAGVKAGPYTVCAAPVEHLFGDPERVRQVFDQQDVIAVHCAPVTVEDQPAEQHMVLELPAP